MISTVFYEHVTLRNYPIDKTFIW